MWPKSMLRCTSSMWGSLLGFLPGNASVTMPDRDSDEDGSWDSYWADAKKDIERQLGEHDCIGKIVIRAHGNNQTVGQITAKRLEEPGSAQSKFLEWLKTVRCVEACSIDIKACGVAQGSPGRQFISKISIQSGYKVQAWDDVYAGRGYGKQWEATPDGNSDGTDVKVISDSGRTVDPTNGKKQKGSGCFVRKGKDK